MDPKQRLHPVVAAGLPVAAVGGALLACIGVCVGYPCLTTGIRHGLWVDRCPATDLRLDVSVNAFGLLRGKDGGEVRVVPGARWLDGEGRDAPVGTGVVRRGVSTALVLKDDRGAEVPGLVVGRARKDRGGVTFPVKLPEVPDGDYVLEVKVDAGFEEATVEAPLPLFAPAVVHLMTDRPLYKPGQEVLFRSVALRRTDLAPLEGRPGRWRVRDPNGEEMLVEKDRAGPWGIADGSFPLDADAIVGTWTASWETGAERDEVRFDVRPFRLPRLTVEASPSRKWYGIGQKLVIEGRAEYTSGAPVADAPVDVTLATASGRWPIPLAWEGPRGARTGPDGRFRVEYGEVPADLNELTTLRAVARVTDATGETADTVATVVLSKDSLKVEAVTELGDGLVEGFNNRAYLRVSTPDGRPLSDAALSVKRPYDPSDAGKTTTTDADGVAALQIDPGAPVTVVIPAPPARIRPLVADPPTLASANELASRRGPDLAERRALDRILPAVSACRTYAVGGTQRSLAVHVDRAGVVRKVMNAEDPLSVCLAGAVRGLRMPGGAAQTWSLAWNVPDSLEPHLQVGVQRAFGPEGPVQARLADAALRGRRCLPKGQGIDGAEVLRLHWSVDPGRPAVQVLPEDRGGHGLSPAAVACVRTALGRIELPDRTESGAMGTATITLSVPRPPGSVVPQPTATTAYELAVVASSGDEELGTGRIVLPVGQIPPLRMRATPSLAKPGDSVVVELLRGPSWSGGLPDELWLHEGTVEVVKAKVVDKQVTFAIPENVDGFLHVEYGGARAVVFVQPADPLSVALETGKVAFRPGERGELTVTTRAGERPVAAGVGLVGVDQALGQLAPLLAADDFGRVTVRATADRPAFGSFDPRALVLGQIRGENAAKAAVMRISGLPMDPAGDAPAGASGNRVAGTQEALVESFWRALDRTTTLVREWERTAPAGEQMEPAKMVALWDQALADLAREGKPAADGFGRTLTLGVVPLDLVALVDPRSVVADGTRLPEDVIGWVGYVQAEVGR